MSSGSQLFSVQLGNALRYPVSTAAIALALSSCAYSPRPIVPALHPRTVPVASLLPYTDGCSLCTAVVTGAHEVTVASHCVRDMPDAVIELADGTTLPVLAQRYAGAGLLELRVPGPLPAAVRVGPGPAVYVAGYGCRSELSASAWWRIQLDVREVADGTCDGDSGGGEFNAAGELVRVVRGKRYADGVTVVTATVVGGTLP